MKKLAAPLLALFLSSACGGQRDQAPGSTPPPSPSPAETAPATEATTAAAAPETAAAAPEAAPRPPLLQLQKEAIRRLNEAFNAHDAKRLAALYAPGARIGSPGPSGWIEETGPASVEEGHSRLFSAFPDLKMATPRAFIRGDVVVQEWVARGTHKGDLGKTKPTGNPVGIHAASVYHFNEDGLITADNTYFDSATIRSQIGDSKEKARAVPELPAGETQLIVTSTTTEPGKWEGAARSLYEALDGKDEKALSNLLSKDVTHTSYALPEDRRGDKSALDGFRALIKAFPDLQVQTRNLWGFGDHVIAEVTMTGTQKGPLGKLKPTNKQATMRSLDVVKFSPDGKVIEVVSYGSRTELTAQLKP